MNCYRLQGTLTFVRFFEVLCHNGLHQFYTKCNDFNSQIETEVSTVTFQIHVPMPLNAFHHAVVFRFGATF